jgi:hypothetical protein
MVYKWVNSMSQHNTSVGAAVAMSSMLLTRTIYIYAATACFKS